MTIPKENWILLALRVKPLNAIQLYLTLFYIWDELGRQIPEYFSFKASRYGPYPADSYSSLYGLSEQNLILEPIKKAGVYSLTDQGKATAESISPSIEADTLALVERVSCDISELKPSQLIRKWQSEVPEFANPPLVALEIRHKAMEILRSGKLGAFGEVVKLLGWEDGTTVNALACQLGITSSRLNYLYQRKYLRKREQEERTADRKAKETPGATVVSKSLSFSIWLPDGWLVSSENIEVEDVSEGAQLMDNLQQKHISAEDAYRRLVDGERAKVIGMGEFGKLYEQDKKTAYRLFFKGLLGTPGDEGLEELASRDFSADEAYKRLMADPETFVIDFMTFKQQYEEENQRWQSKLQLKKKQGSQVGYWKAEPKEKGGDDPLLIEVTKFHFREPMSSLELYHTESPGPEDVHTSCRPATRKDLIIDGIQAVKAYYTWQDSWVGDKREPGDEQFSTYLTDDLVGWTIDCWCTRRIDSLILRSRSLFHRIVSSFHRI